MKVSIVARKRFKKEAKRLGKKYPSFENDYYKLLDELEANPHLGTDLGGGVRKVRLAIASKNKGKSGGARVITYYYTLDEATDELALLTIYDKSEVSSISPEIIGQLLAEDE